MVPFRPQQHPVYSHLIRHDRCAIWMGMGGGKTYPEIAAFDTLRTIGHVEKELVVAPLRVARDVWPRAVKDFAPHLSARFLGGTPVERAAALRDLPNIDVASVNFEQLPWLVDNVKPWPWDSIVVDESSKLRGFRGSVQVSTTGKKFLRGGGTMRSRSLATVAFGAKRFIELSGTPRPKGLDQLWGQLWFLDQGRRLGRTFEAFKSKYFYPHPSGYGLMLVPGMDKEIYAAISDICLSIDLKQYMPVSDPVITDVMVDLPPQVAKEYTRFKKTLFAEIEGQEISVASAVAKSIKLLQFANGAVYHDDERNWTRVHDEKLDALNSVIEESSSPVVVVYQFRSDLERIKQKFPSARELKTRKDEDDWNEGRIPILLLHPASAGHGLNLQHGGNVMVMFGLGLDTELYLQVMERIGPMRQLQSGYDRLVHIYRILARGTRDEDVVRVLAGDITQQEFLLAAVRGDACLRSTT